jgi:ADP-ribose pyrophosphatase YjhB (NUDIX family)
MASATATAAAAAAAAKRIIPGAAAVVRLANSVPPTFCFIRRGNQPYQGCWALPGGKLELGETLLACAQRELMEETKISTLSKKVTWNQHGSFMIYDSIANDPENGELKFHYIIAQCFAIAQEKLELIPSDDAVDAKWMTMDEIKVLVDKNQTTPELLQILERAEELHSKGVLATS